MAKKERQGQITYEILNRSDFSQEVIELVLKEIGHEFAWPEAILDSTQAVIIESELFLYKLIRFLTKIPSYTEDNVIATQEVPKTWWDHFKLTYFPKWLLKKYPINYKVIQIIEKKVFMFPNVLRPDQISDVLSGKKITSHIYKGDTI